MTSNEFKQLEQLQCSVCEWSGTKHYPCPVKGALNEAVNSSRQYRYMHGYGERFISEGSCKLFQKKEQKLKRGKTVNAPR